MDAVVNSNELAQTSRSALVSNFWDRYLSVGLEEAHRLFEIETNSNDELIRSIIPEMVGVARERGIDLVNFLREWEEYMEKVSASRTNNGSGELRPVSSDEVAQPQDEDGAASARDDDGEDSRSPEGV